MSKGFKMEEFQGVGIVNPRAVSKATNTVGGKKLLSRSIPGFHYSLNVFYTQISIDPIGPSRLPVPVPDSPLKGPFLDIRLEMGNRRIQLGRFNDKGLEWTGSERGKTATSSYQSADHNALCLRVWDIISKEDQNDIPVQKVIGDVFWQTFLDELPELWTTARVMMT